jgi:hypothetical protein
MPIGQADRDDGCEDDCPKKIDHVATPFCVRLAGELFV